MIQIGDTVRTESEQLARRKLTFLSSIVRVLYIRPDGPKKWLFEVESLQQNGTAYTYTVRLTEFNIGKVFFGKPQCNCPLSRKAYCHHELMAQIAWRKYNDLEINWGNIAKFELRGWRKKEFLKLEKQRSDNYERSSNRKAA